MSDNILRSIVFVIFIIFCMFFLPTPVAYTEHPKAKGLFIYMAR